MALPRCGRMPQRFSGVGSRSQKEASCPFTKANETCKLRGELPRQEQKGCTNHMTSAESPPWPKGPSSFPYPAEQQWSAKPSKPIHPLVKSPCCQVLDREHVRRGRVCMHVASGLEVRCGLLVANCTMLGGIRELRMPAVAGRYA